MYILSRGIAISKTQKQGKPNILFTILVTIDDVTRLVFYPYIIESDTADKAEFLSLLELPLSLMQDF